MAARERYTAQEVAAALHATKGTAYLAAKQLGCTHDTVLNYCKRYPSVQAANDAERGVMVDEAELRLWAAVQAGQPWAIAFTLRTLGRHRGYVEHVENSGTVAVVLSVRYAEPPPEDRPCLPPAS